MATKQENARRYQELLHAMQSGVAVKQSMGGDETSPKHLRVGVNAAMSDQAALVQLLIDKGLFIHDEYLEYLVRFMEREVASYEQFLSDGVQGSVKLA